MVLLTMTYYLRREINLDEVEWDMDTVTAADYTIDLKISEQQYQNFTALLAEEE
jgi:hypothetical protein